MRNPIVGFRLRGFAVKVAPMNAGATSLHFGGLAAGYRFAAARDPRGALTPFDFAALPFLPTRAFVVSGAAGAVRGGHAHAQGQQLLVRIAGEIDVELSFNGEHVSLTLDAHDNAVLIKAPVWARQTYRGEASLLVFADAPFDPNAYLD